MRTSKELNEILCELSVEAEGYQAIVESGKNLDKQQQARWDSLFDSEHGEIDAISNELRQVTQVQNRSKQLAGIRLAQTLGNVPTFPGTTNLSPFDQERGNTMNQPNVLTTRRLQAFKGPDAEGQAYRCGHWLRAVVARLRGGVDEESEQIALSSGYSMTATEGTGSAGGYTVPDPLSAAIIEAREMVGISRQLADVRSMTSDTMNIPKQLTGPSVQYPGEATAITAADSTWGQVSLSAVKRAILSKISNELRADSIINIVDQAASRIGFELAKQEDAEFISGDGTATYGGETGLLDAIGAAGITTGTTTSEDTWVELDLVNFTDLMATLPTQYAGNESWICSNAFYYGVMLKLLVAAGGNTIGMLEAGASRPTFLGKPVYLTDNMPTATAVSTKTFLYGNFREAVIIGDRTQIQLALSEQRYFEEDVIALRAVARYDIAVHAPGDGSNVGAYVCFSTGAAS